MPQNITRGIKALIDEANAEIETLTAKDAIEISKNGDVVIVDIRDPREIERDGRIPGAFSCTRGMLEFWIDPQSPYAKPIFQEDKKFVFHCAGGLRSALAAKTAKDMGLKPVAHIAGGLRRLARRRRPDGAVGAEDEGVRERRVLPPPPSCPGLSRASTPLPR
ncbi:rhodanese-related sulfurtransferase [Bradyrhizobium sp. GM24.11]